MTKLKKIILSGLLIASSIVLNRFLSIRTPISTIGFSFIPGILAAMLMGPAWSMLVAGLADLLGALMFPSGAYFFGYTFSSLLGGLIYGLFLRKTRKLKFGQFLWRLVVSCILVSFICNMCLNTLWIYVTTKRAVAVFGTTRVITQLVMLPIKIVVMSGLHGILLKSGAYKKLYTKPEPEDEDDASEETQDKAQTTIESEDISTNEDKSNKKLKKTKKLKKED